jgi:hypothetical protein
VLLAGRNRHTGAPCSSFCFFIYIYFNQLGVIELLTKFIEMKMEMSTEFVKAVTTLIKWVIVLMTVLALS